MAIAVNVGWGAAGYLERGWSLVKRSMNREKMMTKALGTLLLCALLACGAGNKSEDDPVAGMGAAGAPAATAGTPGTGGPSTSGPSGAGGAAGNLPAAGASGAGGNVVAAGMGGSTATPAGGSSGASGTGSAAGASGSAGGEAPVALEPLARNPKYQSLAPALGEALPMSAPGTWSYLDVAGAVSRDGSPAGFYYKVSKTGNKNLLVYLPGGGVCADNFFCNMNPPNKAASLTAENVGTGVFNIFGPDQEAQDPNGERWQSGIFKDDPTNPAKDWNMVFIPYVTGDVFFGSKPNGTIPNVEGSFQFVGKSNMMKFIARIVPTFKDAQVVLLAGSSAGGIGALLNYPYFADAFIDQGKGARVFVLNDAGPFFDDAHLEVCMQKWYRDIYALNESLPKECTGCFNADGGGMVKGVLSYLADKYPKLVLGGIVDSSQDEIMKFFFSEGLENCSFIDNPIVGLLAYPADRYPMALQHILTNLVPADRISSYIWEGDLHQNLFQTATDDRYYQKNGLDKTVAQWLANLLSGKSERIGVIK